MSGITIICFAASYSIALALEISRLYFQATVRNVVLLGFAVAGLIAHSLFLISEASQGATLISWYHGALSVGWVLAVYYIGITLGAQRSAMGLIVLPTLLIVVGAAPLFPRSNQLSVAAAGRIWSLVHGTSLLLGTTAVAFGFGAGLMFLYQSERLKRKKLWTYRLRLPSLEWLEQATERSLVISCCLLVIGLLAGIFMNLTYSADHRLAWGDPVIWSSALLLCWLVTVLVFNAFYRPARQGRKVAYLTVASFLFLALVLVLLLLIPRSHEPAAPDRRGATEPRSAVWPTRQTLATWAVVGRGGGPS